MRILLDAKDLIDILEHDRPVGPYVFEAYLRRISARQVLSFTVVCDFVGPVFDRGDFMSDNGPCRAN